MTENVFGASPQQRRILNYSPITRTHLVCECEWLVPMPVTSSELENRLIRWLSGFEIFRTQLSINQSGDAIQTVLSTSSPHIVHLDLQSAAENSAELLSQRKHEVRDHVTQEHNRCFGCLIYATEPDQYGVYCVAPSEFVDLETLLLLGNTLCVEAASNESIEERDVLQYAELAEWQNQLNGEEYGADGLAYWRAKFCPSVAGQPLIGERILDEIPEFYPVLTDAYELPVSGLSESQLLSAWHVCIAKLSGNDQVPIGVTTSSRIMEELESSVGNIGRTLPLTMRVDWDETFAELSDRVVSLSVQCKEVQEGFNWQYLRHFGEVGFSDFCFYGFAFHDLDRGADHSRKPIWITATADAEPHLLKCLITLAEGKLFLRFSYVPEVYDKDIVNWLALRFIKIVEQVESEPTTKLKQLNFVLDQEIQIQKTQWNQTEKSHNHSVPFHHLFEKQVFETPDNIAVSVGDASTTYADLNARSNQFARLLADQGIGAGDWIGLCLDRSEKLLIAMLGVMKAGAAYVPIDPSYPVGRINAIATDSSVKLLVANHAEIDGLLENTRGIDDLIVASNTQSRENLTLPTHLDSPAYSVYTSGSTGKPKGVVIAHKSLANYLAWISDRYAIEHGQGTLVHSSISFDLTITSLLGPLVVGQRAIMIPDHRGVDGLIDFLSENKDCSLLKITPSHLDLLTNALSPQQMKNCVRTIVVGGEALHWHTLEPWLENDPSIVFFNEYGPTEATVGCCVERITSETTDRNNRVPIGSPIYNTQLYVFDEDQSFLPIGSTGELYIGGIGLATEYSNEPELTANSFIQKTFSDGDTVRLYRTGDRVKYLSDGRLEYLGRNDSQVKLRGFRIELGEIESVLRDQDRIEDAVVLLVDIGSENLRNDVLVAYVVTSESLADTDFVNEKEKLQQRLPEYMVPSHWVGLTSLPLTSHGKVATDQLPMPQIKKPYVAPSSDIERVFVAAWEKVLGVEKVGINDNYFELGGDSIRSIAIISSVKEDGFVFTLNDLFAYPSISQLARVAQQTKSVENRPNAQPFDLISQRIRKDLPADVVDAYPMTVLQQGMIYYNQIHSAEKLYHDIFSYRLHVQMASDLSEALIREAYGLSLKKHDVLRTTFSLSKYGTPLQLVHDRGSDSSLKFEDLRHLSTKEQGIEIERMIDDEKRLGFDIEKLPLARIFIHLLSNDEIQFSLSFHHAIIDGWSDAILLKELFESTMTLLDGQQLSENRLAVRFRDYVALEQEALASDEFRGFWRKNLSGMQHTALPTLSGEGCEDEKNSIHSVVLNISESIGNSLEKVAKSAGVPLKSVLLAAHMRALSLISTQEDVTSSVVSSGRPVSKDGDQALGLFINSLPLRVDFRQMHNETWSRLIDHVFAIETECLKYRRFPYGKMKEFSQLDSVSDFLFYYTDYHNLEGLFDSTGVKLLETKPYERSSYPCVVHFNIDPESKALSGEVEFSSDYLDRAHVVEYATLYTVLLEEIVDSVNGPFESLGPSPSSQPALPFYSDVLFSRNRYLLQQVTEDSLGYWLQRLSGNPVSPRFGTIPKAQSTTQSAHVKSLTRTLSPETTNVLGQVASAHDVSVEALLSTAYATLLIRLSNESDIVVRHVADTERSSSVDHSPWNFQATIAVRTSIEGNPTFAELARQSERNLHSDRAHQNLSYEALYLHGQNERVNHRIPSCHVYFSLTEGGAHESDAGQLYCLPGQEGRREDYRALELALILDRASSKLTIEWAYDSNLYGDSIIDQCANGFEVLLENITQNSECDVFAYPICSPSDSTHLLDIACLEGCQEQTLKAVHQSVEDQAKKDPDAVALLIDSEETTYGQLNSQANVLAHYLMQECDVEKQQLVGVFLDASVDYVVALLAVLKAGAAYVPMDPDLPADRIRYLCSDARLDVVITRSKFTEKLTDASARAAVIDGEDYERYHADSINGAAAFDPSLEVSGGPAYVIYTSGTTGKPKGVLVHHHAFSGHIHSMANYYQYSADDRALLFTTVGVDATQELLFCALTCGATICIQSDGKTLGEEFDDRCAQQGVTLLDLSPAFAGVLFDNKHSGLEYIKEHVRLLILGGEALTTRLYRLLRQAQLSCRIVNAYGPTESVITSVAFDYPASSDLVFEGSSVPIGKPTGGREAYVLNNQMALVPKGITGELYIGGPYLAQGYLYRKALTDERFVKNPFSQSLTSRLYKTGDIVRWTDENSLQFITRQDNQVSIHGFRVELGEIESLLLDNELVSEVAVLVDRQTDGSNRLLAYVVLESSVSSQAHRSSENQLVADKLRQYLSSKVADYMVPRFYRVVESIPLNTSGKVDQQHLLDLEIAEIDEYSAPSTNTEQELCALWQEILDIPKVGVGNNFFRIGGDSLKALQLVSRLKDRGFQVELKDIFSAPTILELVRLLEISDGNQAGEREMGGISANAPGAMIRKRGTQSSTGDQQRGSSVETFAVELDGE